MANITRELLNAPFPQMVKSLGLGIAEAQAALDRVSVKMAQAMAGLKITKNGEAVEDNSLKVQLEKDGHAYSLLALGFTPTFYQFTDTLIEIKMSFSMSETKEKSIEAEVGASYFGIVSASVTGSYSQKYQYSAEGSSLMRTKLVAIPSPPIFEQRLKALIENETQTA